MAKVQIGSMDFPTKKAAKDFYRAIRDKYPNGMKINDEDFQHLQEMVYVHHEADMKVGVGISHFTVERDAEFKNSRHFTIHRTDGSQTDVSFLTAIDGPNQRRDKYTALRQAVAEQILNFRDVFFNTEKTALCPLRGTSITPSTCHVDHIPPLTFLTLANEWMNAEKISISDIEITPSTDNQITTIMTNEQQKTKWQEFHATHAKLRVLSKIANLSDAKKHISHLEVSRRT